MVVGSQARILYSDQRGRTALALRLTKAITILIILYLVKPNSSSLYLMKTLISRFNAAIAAGAIEGTIVISRDHHDVSGTDSPFR